MSKTKDLSKALKFILNILLLSLGIIVLISIMRFINEDLRAIEFTHRFIVNGLFIFVLFFLRKIVNSLIKQSPFSKNNIKYFRYISYFLLSLAAIDLLANIQNFSGTVILSIAPYFAIHFSSLLYLAFGFLSLIFSEVFRQAYELKKENELTI